MRFSSVALMAGSALAGEAVPAASTAYATHLVTITACPETVTNCPARSMTSSVVTSIVPLATSTAFMTRVHTVTSCAPSVTDCPARSTVLSTEVVPVPTVAPPTLLPSSVGPSRVANSTLPAVSTASSALPSGPATGVPTGVPPVFSTRQPECVGSVVAVTKSYTTVLTSVEYSTMPCATQPATRPTQGPSGTVTPPVATPPAVTPVPGRNT